MHAVPSESTIGSSDHSVTMLTLRHANYNNNNRVACSVFPQTASNERVQNDCMMVSGKFTGIRPLLCLIVSPFLSVTVSLALFLAAFFSLCFYPRLSLSVCLFRLWSDSLCFCLSACPSL